MSIPFGMRVGGEEGVFVRSCRCTFPAIFVLYMCYNNAKGAALSKYRLRYILLAFMMDLKMGTKPKLNLQFMSGFFFGGCLFCFWVENACCAANSMSTSCRWGLILQVP